MFVGEATVSEWIKESLLANKIVIVTYTCEV